MIKEFVQTRENLATLSTKLAFKQAVLFLVFVTFLEVVKSEVLAVGYVTLEAKISSDVDIFALSDDYLVVGINFVLLYELLA